MTEVSVVYDETSKLLLILVGFLNYDWKEREKFYIFPLSLGEQSKNDDWSTFIFLSSFWEGN